MIYTLFSKISGIAKIIVDACLREEIKEKSTNLKELESLHNKYLKRQEVVLFDFN